MSKAIVGRAPCGCVVAADIAPGPTGAQDMVDAGHIVQAVTREEAIRLFNERKPWPCEHERARVDAGLKPSYE